VSPPVSKRLPMGLAAAVLLVSGCAVGPDYREPAPPDTQSYLPGPPWTPTAATDSPLGAEQRFVPGADIPGQWWTLFHSKPLNDLVERALKANPDLAAAQAALKQAHENVYAQQGVYFPQITGDFSDTRNKTATGSVSPASASGNPYYSLATAQLSVSFTPDVFGLNRRNVESLAALAENQRFQLEATYLTLTSNVVAAAILEASLRGQIDTTEATIKIDTEAADVLRKQFAQGQVARGDVIAQEAILQLAIGTLPPLQKQLAQQRDLLAALTGGVPSQELPETFALDGFQLPVEIPVTLPSTLVEQRPDVLAAAATLHSQSALIGVAVANRLPQFTLTALGGSQANQITSLFTPGNGFWTLGADLTAPLFDGFTLLHKERAARAGFEQAAAQYRSTVISALQNVADSLRALQYDADALKAAAVAERSAEESLNISRTQLRLGAVSYLAPLTAEASYLTARLARVQAQAARLSDTAALFQALGGGWWNRADVSPDATKGGLFNLE
jgi:NodT family efflux transporter outer membrane factor (OMF) lipoprotein